MSKNLQERKAARQALLESLEKNAYFQGGGGRNDPASLPYEHQGEDPRMLEQAKFEGEAADTKQNMGPAGQELADKQKMLRADEQIVSLKKIAQELDSVMAEMDRKGMYAEASSTEEVYKTVLAEIEKLAKPVEPKLDVVALSTLANHLDKIGCKEEASKIDEVLAELAK